MRRTIILGTILVATGLASCSTVDRPTAPLSPALSVTASVVVALEDNFDAAGSAFDPAKWQVFTNIPQGSATASRVAGKARLQNRAHLTTVQQFDFARGVRVTGQWTVNGATDDFIQILTRTNGMPGGGFGETQNGVQGIAFTQNVGEAPNLMSIGGNGVFDVSTPGSLAIIAGQTYLFEMVDDGFNVSFKLTRQSNPALSRTVTAKSAFVNTTNRVTFHNREQCCGGTHVANLDNVKIEILGIPKAIAAAVSPQQCVAGAANVALDGSASTDEGGVIVSYEWLENGNVIATGATTSAALGLGSHVITLRVTDDEGFKNTTTVAVNVVDTQSPMISLSVDPANLWPPNHEMVLVASGVASVDACGASTLGVTVASNQSANGKGDGNTAPDWSVVANGDGTFDVYVRAERAGNDKGGRVYTITASADDGRGNSTSSVATVTVSHNK